MIEEYRRHGEGTQAVETGHIREVLFGDGMTRPALRPGFLSPYDAWEHAANSKAQGFEEH